MSQPRIYIRDRRVERIAEVDDFGSLEFVSRDNDLGSWTFDLAADSQYAPLLDPDTSGGLAGIVITLDGVPIFSGPVIRREESATTARFQGYCDNYLLWRHEAIPFGGLDYVGTAGVASTAMRQFVNAQIANPSDFPHRQIAELTFPGDPEVGLSIDIIVARYTQMLSALQDMALQGGGLRFWIQQSISWDPAYIEFVVGYRRDLRRDVLFSIAAGTLEDFKHVRQAPSANHVYATSGAGGSTVPADVAPVVEEFDAPSIYKFGRIESFLNRAASDDDAEIRAAAEKVLTEGADRRSVTLTPIETSDLVFGQHYGLGDLVSAIARHDGSVQVEAVVREIHGSITPQKGFAVRPMLGTPGMSNDPSTSQIISRINDRVRVLERTAGSLVQTRTLTGRAADAEDAIGILDAVVSASTFIGEVRLWSGASAPSSNWLLCQGQAISRTTYAALFSAISTTYGAGDGSTTFNIPDLRGRFAMGVSGGHALGSSGGVETVDLRHDHGNTTGQSPDSLNNKTFNAGSGSTDFNPTDHRHTIPADLSTTQSVLNPFQAINYMIRVL